MLHEQAIEVSAALLWSALGRKMAAYTHSTGTGQRYRWVSLCILVEVESREWKLIRRQRALFVMTKEGSFLRDVLHRLLVLGHIPAASCG